MMIALLLAGAFQATAAKPVVQVEVLNRNSGELVDSAEVVMEGGSPPTLRRRTRAGRMSFAVVCSDEVKFWAEVPNDSTYPLPSQPYSCQALVQVKLRPGN